MEINTSTYPKNNPLINPTALSEQKKIATPEKDVNKSAATVDDSLTLSSGSLKLSQLSSDQGSADIVQIENGSQARKVAEQVIFGTRNNPVQAKQAYGNLIQVNLKSLLG